MLNETRRIYYPKKYYKGLSTVKNAIEHSKSAKKWWTQQCN